MHRQGWGLDKEFEEVLKLRTSRHLQACIKLLEEYQGSKLSCKVLAARGNVQPGARCPAENPKLKLLLHCSTSNHIADFTRMLMEEKLFQYFKHASAITLLLPTASL